VPLAMEEGLVAHNIEKENGTYTVTYQKSGLFSAFDNETSYTPGDSLFIFTSIFAPADLKKRVNHHWQWKNSQTGDWETSDKIEFEITGGRDGGYRGYSYKTNILEGKWKVDVTTNDDMILGRINFTVVYDSTNTSRNLETETF